MKTDWAVRIEWLGPVRRFLFMVFGIGPEPKVEFPCNLEIWRSNKGVTVCHKGTTYNVLIGSKPPA